MKAALSLQQVKELYARVAGRYDLQHRILTLGADQRGRRLLLDNTVRVGDRILDCGSGTGTTGLLAAQKAGPNGRVSLFDLNPRMLEVARVKAARRGLQDRVQIYVGDMVRLPFKDESFDVVFSTYSLCPLYDPARGALELYRVTRPGGRIAIGHSAEPEGRIRKSLATRVEHFIWRFPALSLGCRAVEVLPALEAAGARVRLDRLIGVPLWPFRILVLEKEG